jgi:hypothetical protein
MLTRCVFVVWNGDGHLNDVIQVEDKLHESYIKYLYIKNIPEMKWFLSQDEEWLVYVVSLASLPTKEMSFRINKTYFSIKDIEYNVEDLGQGYEANVYVEYELEFDTFNN